MIQAVEQYKEYLKSRLQPVSDILPNIAESDFSGRLEIPAEKDEFTDLYKAINSLLEGLNEQLKNREGTDKMLMESEQKYKTLFEASPEGIVIIDLNGTILDCNNALPQMTKLSKEAIIGKQFMDLDILRPEELSKIMELFPEFLTGEFRDTVEVEIQSGEEKRFLEAFPAIIKKDDEINGLQIMVRDITEKKKAEEQLKESEEKFRDLFENANDLIQSVDAEGKFVYVNKKTLETLGYERDELKNMNFTDILHKDHIPHCMEVFKELCSGESFAKVETVFISKGGHEIIVEGNVNAQIKDGRFTATRGIFRDITERKQTELALKSSESRFKGMIESSPDAITVTDLEGNITECNQATLKMYDFSSKDEVMGLNAMEFIEKTEHEKALKGMMETLETGFVRNLEYNFITSKGRPFFGELSAKVITDSVGTPISFIAITKDITERKKAEEALKESEKKFKAVFEGATDGILAADVKTKRFVLANPMICEMTGYSSEEMLDLDVSQIHPEKDLPGVVEQFNKQIAGELVLAKDIPVLRKDMKVVYCDVNSKLIIFDEQECLVGFFRDITDRMRSEENLKEKVDKLEQFKKITMDREIKMIELKQRIKELEEMTGK